VLGDPAVRAMLTWGISDHYTWLDHEESRADGKPERPLPFDAEGRAKPAFFAMRGAFDQRGAAS
jgi:endo-1,4-beta-xylanase